MSPLLDGKREICLCNSVTLQEIVECIKANELTTLEALTGNPECPVGDKCESCREEGYENDGFSLAMVLSLIRQGRL